MRFIENFTARFEGLRKRESRAVEIYRRHVARAMAEERWSSAEIFLDRIIDVSPTSTEAWLMKAFLSQHCRHDESGAKTCFEKVVSLCGMKSDHPHGIRARQSLKRLAGDLN